MRVRLAVILVVGLLALTGCAKADNGGGVANPGYQSGDGSTSTWAVGHRKGPVALSGADYEGRNQDVSAWLGDVVVLNTWYANCPPCRAEAPDLAAVQDDYAARGLHVLGINHTDAAGDAQAFQTTFGVTYPSIDDSDGSATAALEGIVPVNAVPTTIVLDRDGRVAGRILGVVKPSTLRSMIDELVAEPAPSSATTPVPSLTPAP